ncbi:ubiquitin-like modifier [Apiospora arundinis]
MSGERVDHFLARIKLEQRDKDRGNSAAKPDNKEKDDDNESEVITIKIKDSSRYQRETSWTVKRTDSLWTHLKNYARSIHLNYDPFPGPLRFITFDGTRINEGDTPESLEMEDGDIVDMMQQQDGGQLSWLVEI